MLVTIVDMKPDMGIYYEMLDRVATSQPSLSFLARRWPDVEAWRTRAQAKVLELIAFDPVKIPLNASVNSRTEDEGLIVENISYDMPYGPRTDALLLYPIKQRGKLPAVVALHDHGEFFYYGKEKVTAFPDEPKLLKDFKSKYYGGKSWATELARRGFAVLVPDVFLFGSRRIPIQCVYEDSPSTGSECVETCSLLDLPKLS